MKYKHLAMIMGVMITATSVGSAATVFAADSQDMKGNVIWDSISHLDFYMTNGSHTGRRICQ